MKKTVLFLVLFSISCFGFSQEIPLPEHPRPDFERSQWQNLNGKWAFEFDSLQTGESKNWQSGSAKFSKQIMVPFPWGSKLSGVKNLADFAWYQREIQIDKSWEGKRVFVTIGASDYETTVWLDGNLLGKHQGGYTPFSFDLTPFAKFGTTQKLVVKVDDKRRDYALYGKQGYGDARGIWQTVYLEARGKSYLESVHFSPDIDQNTVKVSLEFDADLQKNEAVSIEIETPQGLLSAKLLAKKGSKTAELTIPIQSPKLWTLEDPYLYYASIKSDNDEVKSYFGMRKIAVHNLPNTNFPYVSLNNKPIYLQLTLDQSYHPDGFYTFPSDEFMKNEIQLCKNIGLNGLRTHIKVDIPRKLYWADKLGLLVMADLPNFWGEPNPAAQKESEFTLRQMIKRDYNHPAIFSWIVFNETWGLRSKVLNRETNKEESKYLPKTQNWVASMYYLTKSLDQTRLVEDNSICCGAGHTETDINSWHEYLPGWAWEDHLKKITENTFEGSTHHFEKGFKQGLQPNINSECGNVWGYDGSTGDVDWSWDYHRMMNTFRKYPKIAGWLYTEHHDVINEWNGYWKFDRTNKFSGTYEMVEGMTDKDFHAPFYVSTGNEISKTVKAGEILDLPIYLSVMTDEKISDSMLKLEFNVEFMDKAGQIKNLENKVIDIPYEAWMQKQLNNYQYQVPNIGGLGIVKMILKTKEGIQLHHNFFSFEVDSDNTESDISIVSVNAKDFRKAEWSKKQWNVLDGLKVNGAGKGYFEYQIDASKIKNVAKAKEAYFLVELSSKPMLDKDLNKKIEGNPDYMLGAVVSPHVNPNAYPMTDTYKNPSNISIYLNGKKSVSHTLADDPADHRGVLSWHHQPKERKLHEAGTYGELVKIVLNAEDLKSIKNLGYLTVKIEANQGLAVYSDKFGRFPVNPSLVLKW